MKNKKKKPIVERVQLVISLILRITLVIAIVDAGIHSRWMVLFVSSLALVLSFIPSLIEKNYKIMLPTEFEFLIVLFIYTSIFLGEVHNYYIKFWWWDAVLHTGSAFGLGIVGFLITYVLYTEQKVHAKPVTIALLSFTFALAIGAMWEIFEFGMDSFFGFNMQKSGLIDTMWDLIVDAIGALLASFLGFLYLKGVKTPLFRGLLEKFFEENPKLMEALEKY